MSSDDVAIRVRDVSKHYLQFKRPEDRLKQSIVPRLRRLTGLPERWYYHDVVALKSISLDVRRGETIGIVGRNGSGKSTLLKVICGILRPSTGSVELNGRIAALLELGAGFNPEFTGRENVYLNGAILGLSRAEVDRRFASIARFADIGEFIELPVKTYSSGMYVRLAFATAINVDPDILVIDEALAVGDEAFQRKCYARIEEIQAAGSTILFVSHSASSIVQFCSRAVLIDGGEAILEGSPKIILSHYQRLLNHPANERKGIRDAIRLMRDSTPKAHSSSPTARKGGHYAEGKVHRVTNLSVSTIVPSEGFDEGLSSQSRVEYQAAGARIRDLRLLSASGEQVNILQMRRRYTYEYFVDFTAEATFVAFGMLIKTIKGVEIGGATTGRSRSSRLKHVPAGSTIRVRFEFDCILLPATYLINAGVLGVLNGNEHYLHRVLDALAFRVVTLEELSATGIVDLGVETEAVIFVPSAISADTNE